MKYSSHNNEEIKTLIGESVFEPEIFRSFVTYWSMRKSDSLNTNSHINEIKSNSPEKWLTLIESNHKFRNLYGEKIAQDLIKVIQAKPV